MHSMSLRVRLGRIGITSAAGALVVLSSGCGGGGGGSSAKLHGDLSDPVIPLVGNPGLLSQTPTDANTSNGTTPPPVYETQVTSTSHWFRIAFPFPVNRASILSSDPIYLPFSTLNGNITVNDKDGGHIPGIALVNGVDAFGVNRSKQSGFPHDVQNGVDLNLSPNVFLYVADVDGSLATPAAWGPSPNAPADTQTATVDRVRVGVSTVNGWNANTLWTFHVGTTANANPAALTSIASEEKDPTDPTNPNSTSSRGSFIVRFAEPMIPQTVGRSAVLNGFPFDANLPVPPFAKPLPNTAIIAKLMANSSTLFVPFDCNPVNKNNLATYRLTPLVDLPSKSTVDLLVRSFSNNRGSSGRAATNLFGTPFDGTGDPPDHADVTVTFSVGPGHAVVNIPVSPEVVYWLPNQGDGIGAIDLNGWGYTTNTPGANAGIRERASIITKSAWDRLMVLYPNPEGMNPFSHASIGLLGHPGFEYDRYLYPVGTGGFAYGAGTTQGWLGLASDTGNSGTLFPGINEMSSGFETICRDSEGSAILTGAEFGEVGNIQDFAIGEFLDRVYYDRQNFFSNNAFHVSVFGGGSTQGRNTIADPPTPNPPPTRYWVGLPQLGVAINQDDPTSPVLFIEGDQVFLGDRQLNPPSTLNGAFVGFQQLRVNPDDPNSGDVTIFPHKSIGPGTRSATAIYTFSSRQQIGNFLYATDATNRELQVINSNTMRLISSLSLPDPTGIAMSPDMEFVFVTNFGDDTMSVVGADPTSANFHKELARVRTGVGPKALSVQPENEDIFVCDFLGNTISIINSASLTIRKQLTSLINGPFDVETTERQQQPGAPHPFGWGSGIYFGYISNFAGNTVVVFESGPDGPQGIGIDNIRGALPTGDDKPAIIAPRGLCFSPYADPAGLLAGGVFIAHQDDLGFGRVSHIQFTQQAIFGTLPIQVPPGFFIPPGFTDRVFEVVGTWGDTDASRLAGHFPSDVALGDVNTASYQSKPSGAPNFGATSTPPSPEQTGFINSKNHMRLAPQAMGPAHLPDRLYVCFEDTDVIQVLEPTSAGTISKTIPGHGVQGTKKLCTFWR